MHFGSCFAYFCGFGSESRDHKCFWSGSGSREPNHFFLWKIFNFGEVFRKFWMFLFWFLKIDEFIFGNIGILIFWSERMILHLYHIFMNLLFFITSESGCVHFLILLLYISLSIYILSLYIPLLFIPFLFIYSLFLSPVYLCTLSFYPPSLYILSLSFYPLSLYIPLLFISRFSLYPLSLYISFLFLSFFFLYPIRLSVQ